MPPLKCLFLVSYNSTGKKARNLPMFKIKIETTFEINKRGGVEYDILIMHIYPAKYGDRRINFCFLSYPLVTLGLRVAKPKKDYFIFCQLILIRNNYYICKRFTPRYKPKEII